MSCVATQYYYTGGSEAGFLSNAVKKYEFTVTERQEHGTGKLRTKHIVFKCGYDFIPNNFYLEILILNI